MQLAPLVVTDDSPAKVTRFAEILWQEHPDIISMIGDENITPVPVDADFGGIGNEGLLREVQFNLTAKFYNDMTATQVSKLVDGMQVIRQVSIDSGLGIEEVVTDYIDALSNLEGSRKAE